jgi:type II secretory pathway pseudopilin PulG
MKQTLIERMLYVALAVIFIAVGVGTYFSAQAFDKSAQQQKALREQQTVLQQQVAGQKEVLKGMRELLDNQGQTTKDINKSLSCILVFFSSPNRDSYYISDLETCTITNTTTGDTEILELPHAATPQAQPQASAPDGASNPSWQGSSQQSAPVKPSAPPKPTQPNNPPSQPPQPSGLVTRTLDGAINAVRNIIGGVSNLLLGGN